MILQLVLHNKVISTSLGGGVLTGPGQPHLRGPRPGPPPAEALCLREFPKKTTPPTHYEEWLQTVQQTQVTPVFGNVGKNISAVLFGEEANEAESDEVSQNLAD